MNTHYCGGHAVESSLTLGKTHLDCGMSEMDLIKTTSSTEYQLKAASCCENKHQVLQVEDQVELHKTAVNLNPAILTALYLVWVNPQPVISTEVDPYIQHTPPLPKQEKQILYGTFLI